MVVTFLSDEERRASSLALLGFSYGMGMVVGPTLGGVVTEHFGEQTAALLAATGALVSLVLVILFFPEIPKKRKEERSTAGVLNVKKILELLFIPKAAALLVIKTFCGIPIGILQSMFSGITSKCPFESLINSNYTFQSLQCKNLGYQLTKMASFCPTSVFSLY